MRVGMHVEVKPDSSLIFKKEMKAFLHSKGFQDREHSDVEGFVLDLAPQSDNASKLSLHAAYYETGDKSPLFYLGKPNTSSFTDAERAMIAACIDFLVLRADAIESGFVSHGSTTRLARAKFYAAIKEH
jgi:hypothetical protein